MRDEKVAINNTADIVKFADKFDTAKFTPVFWGDNKAKTDNYQGVYNIEGKALAMIASKAYTIIQHKDVLRSLGESLKEKNLQVSGVIRNYGNVIVGGLVFGNLGQSIKDDSKQGVKLGIRFTNSYNRVTAFRLEMYGFRMVCQNGMILGKAMNNVVQATFHMGKEKSLEHLKKISTKFIDDAIESSTQLQTYVSECMKDSVAWTQLGKLLEKIFVSQVHRENIAKLFGISIIEVTDKKTKKVHYNYVLEKNGVKNLTRWQLYNAITQYASHHKKKSGKGFSLAMEEVIQTSAQEVLTTKFEDLLTVETQ